jgi:hypothetical protein
MKYFTATLNGQTFLRSSASRTYTHMVVGRRNLDQARASAVSPEAFAQDVRNFRYHERGARGFITNTHARGPAAKEEISLLDWHLGFQFGQRNPERAASEAEADQKRHQTWIAEQGFRTGEEYAQALQAKRVQGLEASVAAGAFQVYHDLGWASRLDLAQKNADSHRGHWVDVTVLPATEVDRATFVALKKVAK